jgi:glycosyltransferase involved in cell wall biosynthesis
MINIYDCSNSPERPSNRGFGGSVENACVKLLKKYSANFDCLFIDDPNKADLFFTNDIFPHWILQYKIPKVKRMDGIFWQQSLMERNEAYNKAAQQADCVLFVSQYSQNSYEYLYGHNLKKSLVALNWVDIDIFYPLGCPENKITSFIAIATDWIREEKRAKALIEFARLLPKEITLIIIGNNSHLLRAHNTICYPYIDNDRQLASILRRYDALINLSYRDASPKVVAEAQSCGLPVLYADSGGTPELVFNGCPIRDIDNKDSIPDISIPNMEIILNNFLYVYPHFKNYTEHSFQKMNNMLSKYFSAFKELINET